MANEIKTILAGTSSLDHLIAPIVAEAQFVAQERSIMRNLVKNFAVPANSGKVLQVPVYGNPTADSVNEADDLSPSAITSSQVDITLGEIGVMTNVSDMAVNYAPANVIADIGRLFGEAIAKKIDQDLCALFDGFGTSVGTDSAALSAATIFNAVANLRANGVPATDLACVVHPMVAYDLKANLTNTFANSNANEVANEALRTGYVGTLAGVPVYETSNISNTGTTGDYKGGLFHRDALALALGADIKIETQRDASARATEMVGTAVYGVAEIHDTYGVEILADSSIQ
jgi:N4-gp56 family major capsid protein